jgi:hypothetical protein
MLKDDEYLYVIDSLEFKGKYENETSSANKMEKTEVQKAIKPSTSIEAKKG